MKKKVIKRCLFGAPIGLLISHIILLITSIFLSVATKKYEGDFLPAPWSLIELCGSELNAVIIQTICSLIFGAAFGGASVIWEIENWSFLKQTVLHLIIISVSSLPIAYCMYWIPHTIRGIGYSDLCFYLLHYLFLHLARSILCYEEKNPGDQREGKCRFGKQLINCLAAKWDDSCLAAFSIAIFSDS